MEPVLKSEADQVVAGSELTFEFNFPTALPQQETAVAAPQTEKKQEEPKPERTPEAKAPETFVPPTFSAPKAAEAGDSEKVRELEREIQYLLECE